MRALQARACRHVVHCGGHTGNGLPKGVARWSVAQSGRAACVEVFVAHLEALRHPNGHQLAAVVSGNVIGTKIHDDHCKFTNVQPWVIQATFRQQSRAGGARVTVTICIPSYAWARVDTCAENANSANGE